MKKGIIPFMHEKIQILKIPKRMIEDVNPNNTPVLNEELIRDPGQYYGDTGNHYGFTVSDEAQVEAILHITGSRVEVRNKEGK